MGELLSCRSQLCYASLLRFDIQLTRHLLHKHPFSDKVMGNVTAAKLIELPEQSGQHFASS